MPERSLNQPGFLHLELLVSRNMKSHSKYWKQSFKRTPLDEREREKCKQASKQQIPISKHILQKDNHNTDEEGTLPSRPTLSQNLLNPKTFALVGASLLSLLCAPHLWPPKSLSLPSLSLPNRLAILLTSGFWPPCSSSRPSSASLPLLLHSSTHPLNVSLTLSLSTLLFVSTSAGASPSPPPFLLQHSLGSTPSCTSSSALGLFNNCLFSLILMRFRPKDRAARVVRVMYIRCAIRSASEGRRGSECERLIEARCSRAMWSSGSRERLRSGCEVRVRVSRSGMSRNDKMCRRSSEGSVGRLGELELVAMAGWLVVDIG